MGRTKFFTFAGYFAAVGLVFLPILDAIMPLWPMRPTELAWRYGALGVLAGVVVTTVFGLFCALALAVYHQSRLALRSIMVVAAILFLAHMSAAGLFVLDALAMRGLVNEEARAAFGLASSAALFKHAFAATGALLVSWAAKGEAKRASHAPREKTSDIVASATR